MSWKRRDSEDKLCGNEFGQGRVVDLVLQRLGLVKHRRQERGLRLCEAGASDLTHYPPAQRRAARTAM